MNLPPLRDDASTRAGSVADRSRVSSVAEHIHSSYVRASLLRQAEEKKARKVRFYRNGDKFYRGAVFAVSPERFRTFDSLLAELTRSPICDPKLMPNGVRYVFSLDGSRKILSLDELQEGESYVCATLDVFKDIDYTKTLSPTAWHQSSRAVRSGAASVQLQQQQTPPQSELPPLAGAPRRHTPPAVGGASVAAGLLADGDAVGALAADEAAFVECIKPRLITVVRSGPRPRMSVRVPLNKRTARSLEQVLRGVSDIIRLDSGSVKRMYALSGRQVHCLADFFLEDTVFLACGNERPSLDDFHLDTNEVRLVCAYRFSASTKADRVTLRSQSSARVRQPHHFDTAATEQWSLQMRSQPTSPMVTRRQPRAAAADIRPRPAEERTDSPTLNRQPPSVRGSNCVPLEAHPASHISSEVNSGLHHRGAQAEPLSVAEVATEIVGAAADANNGVGTGDDDARILIEQQQDQTTPNTEAADSEPRYYDDDKHDDRNDVTDNAAAGNVTSPDAGSQMSYAAADAASTATARTDEGGESLPLDDDEHDLGSGDGSGGEDFSELSADVSVISRTSTGGSGHGARSLDLHADDEESGVEQPLGSRTKDSRRTRSNDGQGGEQTRQEQQPQPPPPRPVLPQPQRRPQQSMANGHVVRDLRQEAGNGRRANGRSTPEARRESGSLSGRSSSHENSSSPPHSVVNTATVKNAEVESSISNDPSQPLLTQPNALSSLEPEVTVERHGLENENPAASAAFAPVVDKLKPNADAEAGSVANKFAIATGTASDVPAAADHLEGEDAPTSVDAEDAKAQMVGDQPEVSVAFDGATVNGMEIDYSVEAAEGTAIVANRPADDVTSGAAGLGISNQLEDALNAETVAAVTKVADSQADDNTLHIAVATKDDEAMVTADDQALVFASDKVAADVLPNGVPAEVTVAAILGTDRSEIDVESSAASDCRERESAAEAATAEAPVNIAHNGASGAAPLEEIARDATEMTYTENQEAPDKYTAAVETSSNIEATSVLETAARLENDRKNKEEARGSSGPESTAAAHDADVVPADADAPTAQNNSDIDAELTGASEDAQRDRIDDRMESDEEGEELVLRRYQVLRTIADDKSLTIKECVSRDTGRTLALKVVSKSASTPEELQAISKEARLLRDVNHMNIIGLVDGFETRKAWYLVTDLDEGLDVVSTILTAETFSEADAASLFGDLLNALRYLHSRNVIHGSVGIDKLLVVAVSTQSTRAAPTSIGRRLKLGGFSFAATLDESTAAVGSATEGAKHEDDIRVDQASSAEGTRHRASMITDLIAAGEVLWTLLTGRAMPEDKRLRIEDIIEETANLGVSQEARKLLTALLETTNESGIHTADEALSHSWFALATATSNTASSIYHEDRREAIAVNARTNFSHKRKYSTKATAINILKTSIRSEDFKCASANKIESNLQENDNKHVMTESDSADKRTSAAAEEETALVTSASDAFSADATSTGDVRAVELASLIASGDKRRQSESPSFTLTANQDRSVDENRKNETVGAAASHDDVFVANRLESSSLPKEEQKTAAQRDADVQWAISGKDDGHIEGALQNAAEEQRSALSGPVAGTFEDEDEYF